MDSIGLPLAWIEAAVKGGYQSQIGARSKITSHLLDGLYGQQGGPDGLGLGCALLQSKPALTCVLIQHGNRFKKLWDGTVRPRDARAGTASSLHTAGAHPPESAWLAGTARMMAWFELFRSATKPLDANASRLSEHEVLHAIISCLES